MNIVSKIKSELNKLDEIKDALNKLDNAFNRYFIGDMNSARADYHDVPIEEIKECVVPEGILMGRKIKRFNPNSKDIKKWVEILIEHRNDDTSPSFEYLDNEGELKDSKKCFENLCLLYQLDEHRSEVIKLFTDACIGELWKG